MRPAGQQPEAGRRLVELLAFRQDAPPDGDHRVGREHEGALALVDALEVLDRDRGLFARQPLGERTRGLRLLGRFVHVCGGKHVRRHAGLLQEGQTARTTGGEDELGGHLDSLRMVHSKEADRPTGEGSPLL